MHINSNDNEKAKFIKKHPCLHHGGRDALWKIKKKGKERNKNLKDWHFSTPYSNCFRNFILLYKVDNAIINQKYAKTTNILFHYSPFILTHVLKLLPSLFFIIIIVQLHFNHQQTMFEDIVNHSLVALSSTVAWQAYLTIVQPHFNHQQTMFEGVVNHSLVCVYMSFVRLRGHMDI